MSSINTINDGDSPGVTPYENIRLALLNVLGISDTAQGYARPNKMELVNAATYVTADASGNMQLVDAVAGTKKLSDLVVAEPPLPVVDIEASGLGVS